MGITKSIKKRGIVLENAYIRPVQIKVYYQVFANKEESVNGQVFESESEYISVIDEHVYAKLKELPGFKEATDVLDDSWKDEIKKEEVS